MTVKHLKEILEQYDENIRLGIFAGYELSENEIENKRTNKARGMYLNDIWYNPTDKKIYIGFGS